MRHLPIARPGAALVAACLMTTTPFASSQIPAAPPSASQTASAADVPQGPQAVAPASTPEALSAELVGKTFFLRGFYQDDKLQFATDGKVTGSPQKGSFALSAVEIDKVKFTKHTMEIEAHRVGLHFFGALPYEDDSKPFERIKVDPKKLMNIEIERLVIEPEKKKKKKDEKKKDEKEIVAKAAAPAASGAAKQDAESLPARAGNGPARLPRRRLAAGNAAPAVAPNHDPRVSFLQLSKALNVMFAPSLNDSVIATLPGYLAELLRHQGRQGAHAAGRRFCIAAGRRGEAAAVADGARSGVERLRAEKQHRRHGLSADGGGRQWASRHRDHRAPDRLWPGREGRGGGRARAVPRGHAERQACAGAGEPAGDIPYLFESYEAEWNSRANAGCSTRQQAAFERPCTGGCDSALSKSSRTAQPPCSRH